MAASRPFEALYVHVPFCTAKCGYCAFYSVPGATAERQRAYLARVEAEFAESAGRCSALRSVFVGGGTPSALEPEELAALLDAIRRHFRLAPGAEVTVECNPETVCPRRAHVLAAAGVNRVSLGIQAFDPALRGVLGRRGTGEGVEAAVATLRAAGIGNLGGDLIYAIPGQSVAAWRTALRRACSLGLRHLSTYELTWEEGTRLAASGQAPVDAATAVAMWECAEAEAAAVGLTRYEISNLALPGAECRHNLEIWHGGTYLGCGPAASSFDGDLRWTQVADLDAWLRGAPAATDPLAPEARAAEILAFGLRTVGGWSRERFRERTGFDYLDLRRDELRRLAEDGLVEVDAGSLRPTRNGLLFADAVATRLL